MSDLNAFALDLLCEQKYVEWDKFNRDIQASSLNLASIASGLK